MSQTSQPTEEESDEASGNSQVQGLIFCNEIQIAKFLIFPAYLSSACLAIYVFTPGQEGKHPRPDDLDHHQARTEQSLSGVFANYHQGDFDVRPGHFGDISSE